MAAPASRGAISLRGKELGDTDYIYGPVWLDEGRNEAARPNVQYTHGSDDSPFFNADRGSNNCSDACTEHRCLQDE
jgi:hypothetical protein